MGFRRDARGARSPGSVLGVVPGELLDCLDSNLSNSLHDFSGHGFRELDECPPSVPSEPPANVVVHGFEKLVGDDLVAGNTASCVVLFDYVEYSIDLRGLFRSRH